MSLARRNQLRFPNAGPSSVRRMALQRLGTRMRQMFQNRMRMRFAQSRKKQIRSGQGVTDHHDSRLIYRKKNMPRFKKARWRSFNRKVEAVSERDLGSQTVVFNKPETVGNSVAGNQVLATYALYGVNSGTNTTYDDLDQIGAFNALAVTTPTTGLSIGPSSKVIFKSAVMDLTIRNGSSFNTDEGPVADSAARMEVDVYEIIVRKGDERGAEYADLLALLAQNPVRTDPIGGAGTEINLSLRGVTPFDCVYALSNFGIKILSKRKYQISNGDQVTYQIRDPRRHVLLQRELQAFEGPIKGNLTRCVLVIGRIAPGLPVGGTIGTYNEVLEIGITRKYLYKIENYTEDRTRYQVS